MNSNQTEPATSKICTGCQVDLPVSAFNRHSGRGDGLECRCKSCCRRDRHARYERAKGRRIVPRQPIRSAAEIAAIQSRGVQQCLHCHQMLGVEQFDLTRIGNPRQVCRSCRRIQVRAWASANEARCRAGMRARACRQYGITPSDFDQMIATQGNCCAICGLPLGLRYQSIDHDHATGRVRGIVHRHCNFALGHAHEDLRVLVGCILYLQQHHPRKVWDLLRRTFVTSNQESRPCPSASA